MNATEQLHAYQERTEILRQMVETRDRIIKNLEREIRELREALTGTPSEWDGKRTEVVA
jgi:predicted RNase H-like nuclease (RuvC/YqgF family)